MNPKVSIIILNWNGWQDTIECLESLQRITYPNYQVVVIDNDSANNSMEYIKKWAEGKLDVWVKPDNPLRHLSFPPVKKSIPYLFYNRKETIKGRNPEKEKESISKWQMLEFNLFPIKLTYLNSRVMLIPNNIEENL